MAVTAIIVGTDESQISETRRGLAAQSRPVDFVVEVANLTEVGQQIQTEWIWPLAAGMHPLPVALEALMAVAERSPSATWIAPKLVSPERPREIQEYGLTVAGLWNPISPVSGEFDQAQHDHKEDLLAATSMGSLLQVGALHAAGGFDQRGFARAKTITNDYRLAISMRLNGHRVLAAPRARIGVAPGSVGFTAQKPLAIREAQLQLMAGYRNPMLTLLGGLFAPLLSLFAAIWLVLVKRPERIPTTIAAAFWWFAMGFALISRRAKLTAQQRSGLKALSVLFADREEIQRSLRARVELPAAIAEANLEQVTEDESPRFLASGGPWFMALLAAVSWQFWPRDLAITGGGALPLGTDLGQLFSRAGASWQTSGFGLAAPSDPFGWVLFALGAVTFWAPTLSITLLVFLAKPLAFASAWRLLSLVSRRRALLVIGAIGYAFWPALTVAQQQARLGTLVALILLPLFAFTLARILQFGASPRRSVQTWTWVGTSALLAAVISAGAPSLIPLLAAVILLLAVYRFKRIGYLMWIPIPLLVIWLPYAWYLAVAKAMPMAVLTDPGVPVKNSQFEIWKLLLGTQAAGPFSQYLVFATAFTLVIGLTATVGRRSLSAMWLWVALAASVATAHVYNLFNFRLPIAAADASGGSLQAMSPGSPYALIGLEGLIAAVLLVLALDAAGKPLRFIGAGLGLLASLTLVGQFVLQPAKLNWSDGSLAPALVQAQVEQTGGARVLQLSKSQTTTDTQLIGASLVSGAGLQLQDLSTAYNYSVADLQRTDPRYVQLAQLTADLASANGNNVGKQLKRFGINYVLVPNSSAASKLGDALDTVPQLEPVGVTDFGRLYRVKESGTVANNLGWQWSLTKQVQVAVLALFALLAIPTRRRVTSSTHDEEELDAFGEGFEGENY